MKRNLPKVCRIHVFNKYLLSMYYVTGDTPGYPAVHQKTKIVAFPELTFKPEETDNKQPTK